MAFKHNELEIPKEGNPFQNCQLGREKYARILTDIIDSEQDGFVLALNNKWGTGKTTFVRMWEQHLRNENFSTIYFNAWENDFEDNPLTAFIAELKVIDKAQNDKFTEVVKKAAVISKHVIPALFASFVKKYIDAETMTTALADSSKGVLEIFENDVEDYSKRKDSIKDFKKSLSEYVANEAKDKPLVFIIDELDRCRPNYAVLLLEQVKHFFTVRNIVFVLSIDKTQLGNAICGVYGSEKMDADEYLRRFIDIEYSLPEPEREKFINYLYDCFGYNEYFGHQIRMANRDTKYDKVSFISTCNVLLNKTTLRQQEKILSHTRIALRTFKYNNYVLPSLFIFLSYTKIIHPDFYYKLQEKAFSLSETQNEFYVIVDYEDKNYNEKRILVEIEALLLGLYDTYKFEHPNESKLKGRNPETGVFLLNIKSKIDDSFFSKLLLDDYFFASTIDNTRLNFLLDRISLSSDIIKY